MRLTARNLAGIAGTRLAETAFSSVRWPKSWSNDSVKLLNGEIKRRTNVIGVSPNTESVIRFVCALLFENNDEMATFGRRYLVAGTIISLVNDLCGKNGQTLPSLDAVPQ